MDVGLSSPARRKAAGAAREPIAPGSADTPVLRTAPIVPGRVLLLIFAVIGWIPVLCVREVLLTEQPVDEVIQLLAVATVGVFLLGGLTWSWLEHRRFGESVCTLLTFPVETGGPLHADIECGLSLESREPIVVQLTNQVPRGKMFHACWRVERRIDPGELTKGRPGRVVVPVRLFIPVKPAEGLGPAVFAGYGPRWLLELKRKSAGIDFHAEFVLPVNDPIGWPQAD